MVDLVIHLAGIRGNGHMMMSEASNYGVAAAIIGWIVAKAH